jgi:anti-anti-sigma factor
VQINEQIVSGIIVVALQGDFDAATAPAVDKRLQTLLRAAQCRLLVDLSGVSYIASAGLRVLLAALKRGRGCGSDLRLACLRPAVKEVFDMAGFTPLFRIYADVEAGLAGFR